MQLPVNNGVNAAVEATINFQESIGQPLSDHEKSMLYASTFEQATGMTPAQYAIANQSNKGTAAPISPLSPGDPLPGSEQTVETAIPMVDENGTAYIAVTTLEGNSYRFSPEYAEEIYLANNIQTTWEGSNTVQTISEGDFTTTVYPDGSWTMRNDVNGMQAGSGGPGSWGEKQLDIILHESDLPSENHYYSANGYTAIVNQDESWVMVSESTGLIQASGTDGSWGKPATDRMLGLANANEAMPLPTSKYFPGSTGHEHTVEATYDAPEKYTTPGEYSLENGNILRVKEGGSYEEIDGQNGMTIASGSAGSFGNEDYSKDFQIDGSRQAEGYYTSQVFSTTETNSVEPIAITVGGQTMYIVGAMQITDEMREAAKNYDVNKDQVIKWMNLGSELEWAHLTGQLDQQNYERARSELNRIIALGSISEEVFQMSKQDMTVEAGSSSLEKPVDLNGDSVISAYDAVAAIGEAYNKIAPIANALEEQGLVRFNEDGTLAYKDPNLSDAIHANIEANEWYGEHQDKVDSEISEANLNSVFYSDVSGLLDPGPGSGGDLKAVDMDGDGFITIKDTYHAAWEFNVYMDNEFVPMAESQGITMGTDGHAVIPDVLRINVDNYVNGDSSLSNVDRVEITYMNDIIGLGQEAAGTFNATNAHPVQHLVAAMQPDSSIAYLLSAAALDLQYVDTYGTRTVGFYNGEARPEEQVSLADAIKVCTDAGGINYILIPFVILGTGVHSVAGAIFDYDASNPYETREAVENNAYIKWLNPISTLAFGIDMDNMHTSQTVQGWERVNLVLSKPDQLMQLALVATLPFTLEGIAAAIATGSIRTAAAALLTTAGARQVAKQAGKYFLQAGKYFLIGNIFNYSFSQAGSYLSSGKFYAPIDFQHTLGYNLSDPIGGIIIPVADHLLTGWLMTGVGKAVLGADGVLRASGRSILNTVGVRSAAEVAGREAATKVATDAAAKVATEAATQGAKQVVVTSMSESLAVGARVLSKQLPSEIIKGGAIWLAADNIISLLGTGEYLEPSAQVKSFIFGAGVAATVRTIMTGVGAIFKGLATMPYWQTKWINPATDKISTYTTKLTRWVEGVGDVEVTLRLPIAETAQKMGKTLTVPGCCGSALARLDRFGVRK